MKITKQKLLEIIKEEIYSDPALRSAIEKLSDKIDNLDVSIDYLASAITGEDALSIGLSQKALGRLRKAPSVSVGKSDVSENNDED